jgi:hypothetical protein
MNRPSRPAYCDGAADVVPSVTAMRSSIRWVRCRSSTATSEPNDADWRASAVRTASLAITSSISRCSSGLETTRLRDLLGRLASGRLTHDLLEPPLGTLTLERGGDCGLQVDVCQHLGDDPLHHALLDRGVGHVLGERPGERPLHGPLDSA